MSSAEFSRLTQAQESLQFTVSDGSRVTSGRVRFQRRPSPRLALILANRTSPPNRERIIEQYLLAYNGSETEILSAIDSYKLRGSLDDVNSWKRSLEIIAPAYKAGRVELPYELQQSLGRRVPLELARQILDQADRYPIGIARAAESRLRDAITRRIVPVAEVARRDAWFDS
jgi:hypothetical protein